MYYINTITLRYPMRPTAIRAENPNISFPEIFSPPDNYKLVYPSEKPSFDEWTQTVIELTPTLVGDTWIQQWQIVPRFNEYTNESGTIVTVAHQETDYRQNRYDAAAAGIRNQRNKLLSDSDWTQTVDSPVDKVAWAAYRQALRDITSQPEFPWRNTNWPTAPQ